MKEEKNGNRYINKQLLRRLKFANYSECLFMCTMDEANASEVTLRNLTSLAHPFEERYRARGGADSPGLRTTGLSCACLEMF